MSFRANALNSRGIVGAGNPGRFAPTSWWRTQSAPNRSPIAYSLFIRIYGFKNARETVDFRLYRTPRDQGINGAITGNFVQLTGILHWLEPSLIANDREAVAARSMSVN
jgi:hypothetical protein